MAKVEKSKSEGTTVRVACARCDSATRHTVERAVEWSDHFEEAGIHAWGTFQIARCNGCDSLTFRSLCSNSEDSYFTDSGEVLDETEQLYPERPRRTIADELYLRDDVYEVPEIIQAIYRETLASVQHNLSTLAGIGIRSVVEAVCLELKAGSRNLEQQIDELASRSLLTSEGAQILHGIRLLGNLAAHEMKAPTTRQITAALKVIDHLLLGVYVLPQEASVLPKPKAKNAPPRGKKEPK